MALNDLIPKLKKLNYKQLMLIIEMVKEMKSK